MYVIPSTSKINMTMNLTDFSEQFSCHHLPSIVCLSIGGEKKQWDTLHLFTPHISLIDMQMLPSTPTPHKKRKSVIKIQVMYSCF